MKKNEHDQDIEALEKSSPNLRAIGAVLLISTGLCGIATFTLLEEKPYQNQALQQNQESTNDSTTPLNSNGVIPNGNQELSPAQQKQARTSPNGGTVNGNQNRTQNSGKSPANYDGRKSLNNEPSESANFQNGSLNSTSSGPEGSRNSNSPSGNQNAGYNQSQDDFEIQRNSFRNGNQNGFGAGEANEYDTGTEGANPGNSVNGRARAKQNFAYSNAPGINLPSASDFSDLPDFNKKSDSEALNKKLRKAKPKSRKQIKKQEEAQLAKIKKEIGAPPPAKKLKKGLYDPWAQEYTEVISDEQKEINRKAKQALKARKEEAKRQKSFSAKKLGSSK